MGQIPRSTERTSGWQIKYIHTYIHTYTNAAQQKKLVGDSQSRNKNVVFCLFLNRALRRSRRAAAAFRAWRGAAWNVPTVILHDTPEIANLCPRNRSFLRRRVMRQGDCVFTPWLAKTVLVSTF